MIVIAASLYGYVNQLISFHVLSLYAFENDVECKSKKKWVSKHILNWLVDCEMCESNNDYHKHAHWQKTRKKQAIIVSY